MERTEQRTVPGSAIGGVVLVAVLALVAAPRSGVAQQPAPGESAESDSASGGKSDQKSPEPGGEKQSSGPTPKVVLLPVGSANEEISSIVPQRIGELLRERLGKAGRIDLLAPYEEMYAAEQAESSGAAVIQRARKRYRSGIGLANAGEHEKAAEKLSKAVKLLRENIEKLEKFSVYTDALLKLGWSYWEIDHNYDARKSIREFAHLRPEAKLDPKKYPKKLRELHATESKKVADAGSGKLVIESTPGGATVRIDGVNKGKTPVTVTDVGFGYHYLVVEGPEGRRVARQLRVRGRGEKQTYAIELGEAKSAKSGESAGGEDGAETTEASKQAELPAFYTDLLKAIDDGEFGSANLRPYLKELSNRTEADHVAWVVMVKANREYVAAPFVYRVADGRVVQGDNVTFTLQLSNLRVGVRDLTAAIVENVRKMPEGKEVRTVALGEQQEEDEEGTPAGKASEGESTKVAAKSGQPGTSKEPASGETSSSQGSAQSSSVEPPPQPEPERPDKGGNNALTYLGIGGAAVAVGGLVAGGFLLFNNQPSRPDGFSATVTW